jgi:hypothetical protein
LEAYDKLAQTEGPWQEFTAFQTLYKEDKKCDFKAVRARMINVSSEAGIHEYTGNLLLFMCLSKTLKEYYAEANLPEEMWFAAMNDLKWKLDECKEVQGICGTFVPEWYDRFFKLERFPFGRMQFEIVPFKKEYEKNGLSLKPDSEVINVHIPRTGSRLDRESMLASYKAAAEFFGNSIFVCHSWLLYPRNKEILSPKSNLYAMISDYDVFEEGEYENHRDVWRLFDKMYKGNVDELPQDTSLRRAYAEWIRNGEPTGWGYGVFVYQ